MSCSPAMSILWLQLEDSPHIMFIKSFLSIQEFEFNLCDTRCNQAAFVSLMRWWQMPQFGSTPRLPVLQQFQQLVGGSCL